jgi:lambda repressor-like predicted transcriptional regulator
MREQLTPLMKDRMIVDLRRRGLPLHRIAKRVGMSTSGVKRALDRIAEGRDTSFASSVERN